MKSLQLIYPYYEAPRMLELQIENWNDYASEVKESIHITVVDDGSPTCPALPFMERCQVPCSVYRIHEDILWNMHGARNLGAMMAEDGWLFMSDIDIILPPSMLKSLLGKTVKSDCHYTFERTFVQNPSRKKVHCNTFLVQRSQYWRVGGYDEDYCGTYGGDPEFIRQLTDIGSARHMDDIVLIGYGRMNREEAPAFEGADSSGDRTAGANKRLQLHVEKHRTGNTRASNPIRFAWSKVL